MKYTNNNNPWLAASEANAKEYIKAVRFIDQMKGSRIPSYMGSFDSLLSRNMVPGIKDLGDFINGKNEGIEQGTEVGYNDGFNNGLEKGMKEFIVNGENQFFVDKTDPSRYKVYPFRAVKQITDSPLTGPIIKDFTAKEHFKTELEMYEKFIDDYSQKISKNNDDNLKTVLNSPHKKHFKSKYSVDTTEHLAGFVKPTDFVDFDERKARVEKDIKLRRDYIDSKYSLYKYQSDDPSKINTLEDIIKENNSALDAINEELQALSDRGDVFDDEDEWLFKHLGTEHDKRENIRDIINDYMKDRDAFAEGDIIKSKMEALKNTKSTINNLFAQHKKGTTPMMITDDFDFYNVDQLRKLYVDPLKTKEERDKEPVVDVFSKIQQQKIIAEKSTSVIEAVVDYRTKNKTPITLANLQDQLFVPKNQKVVDLNPDKYLHFKYPKDPNEPMQIEGAVKISTKSNKMPDFRKKKVD